MLFVAAGSPYLMLCAPVAGFCSSEVGGWFSQSPPLGRLWPRSPSNSCCISGLPSTGSPVSSTPTRTTAGRSTPRSTWSAARRRRSSGGAGVPQRSGRLIVEPQLEHLAVLLPVDHLMIGLQHGFGYGVLATVFVDRATAPTGAP